MMMPPTNRNNYNQTQWIEEKGDLTLQMISQHGMHNHPVWLIEVEEDLFLISFFQLYQSTKMTLLRHMTLVFRGNHRNNYNQTQWIEEKWDLTL